MRAEEWKRKKLPGLVTQMAAACQDGQVVNLAEGHDLPNRRNVFQCLDWLIAVIFPGLTGEHPVTKANLEYYLGDLINHVQLDLTPEVERAFRYECRVKCCEQCHVQQQSEAAVIHLLDSLPRVRETMKEDVRAAFAGDPAARSLDEIVLSYPCIEAIVTYRLAHELYLRRVPLLPRMWTERAHSRTGIDINPGAEIGPRFFIDHGTGVVIGETCKIGRNVSLYQGVTLGALAPAKGQSIAGTKRHPTLEDDVIIYAGATILGGETVIGQGAVIGGNVWLTRSVAPRTKVVMAKTELVFLEPKAKAGSAQPAPAAPLQLPPPVKGEFECPAKALCEADGTLAKKGARCAKQKRSPRSTRPRSAS